MGMSRVMAFRQRGQHEQRGQVDERFPVVGTRQVLAVLVVADVAFAFQQTAVIPAIPTIERTLGVSAHWSAWLLSGYLMAATVATPLLGRLADTHGKRRMFLAALLVFLAGSVGAALSPGIVSLLAFRALQGVGGAIFPISFSIARDELADERLGPAIGVLTGAFGAGTALGFGLGGVLAALLSWRLVFGAGALAVAAASVLVVAYVPRREPAAAGHTDMVGAAVLGGALVAVLLALTFGFDYGWRTPGPPVLLAAAVALGAVWFRRELRSPSPLVDLRTLRIRSVLLANLATLALGYGLFGAYYLLPHLLENPRYGFGASVLVSGLYLLPAAVGQLLAGPVAGRVERRQPAKWPFALGMFTSAVALLALAFLHQWPWSVVAAVFALGFGIGFAVSTSSTLVTRDVSERQTGISTALNSTLRRLGGGVGSQLSAGLLVAMAAGGGTGEAAYVIGFTVAAALCALGGALASAIPAGG